MARQTQVFFLGFAQNPGAISDDLFRQRSLGTFDWGGYFNPQYFADPQEQIIGILMKQTRAIGADPTGWQYRQLIEQAVDD